ncbi:MAG: ABC transporter substrate-binding protein [Candidatus Tectomicrobia bacterium RIFCSPLOWO2_12_FULL_69_37]|nr:MAG: ABC transporter substrate-binding protein [Candidatus Tectomicrobia bacterium RIFCSPLOWO2_12_FULL_69_37]OGL61218.1 MAG: ABC transporter substrate-binding protein [Candidatus Tectomicrobia bacterium RIFCSPLOWO2_02_FULL_70_19]
MRPLRLMLRAAALAAALALASAPARAAELEPKLVIVTSFPKDLYNVYAKAFETKYPGTKVEVLNKGTSAGIAYVRETAASPADLFWASAPDAFEVLKGAGLLQKYQEKARGIPAKIGAYPINDPDGFYKGFAASGYGIMWNTRYLKAKNLPDPREWDDLKKPVYHGHVSISAPSRSGTTHLTIETILQGEGWEKGWRTILEMAGNFATVTERSFGVPEGVNNGQFGIGIVIDFFGFSSKASGFPVEFAYPKVTTLVPANIGMIKNAKNPRAAAAFIELLLSPQGQALLLDKKIQRLPVLPSAYEKAKGLPNPFKDLSMGAAVKFDTGVSKSRYLVVNTMFDQIITFRLKELTAAWKTIQAAEAKLKGKPSAQAAGILEQAKKLAGTPPVSARQAGDKQFLGIFRPKKKGQEVPKRQAEVEKEWDAFAKRNYAEAQKLAAQAASMIK